MEAATAALPGQNSALPTEPDVASKRAENAEMLRLAQRRLDSGATADSAAAQDVALHKSVEAVLAQQETVKRQIEELKKRKSELSTELSVTRSAGAEKRTPLSFIEFDRLKDELATEDARAGLASDRLAAAKDALARGKVGLEKSQAKLRQTEEAYNTGKGGPTSAELSTAFEQAKHAVNLRRKPSSSAKKSWKKRRYRTRCSKYPSS
jgi:hypothetical protein